MSFPTTAVLDDFNRSNGALGANWGAPAVSGHGTPTINTNVFMGVASNYASAYWTPDTYEEVEVYCTIPAAATAWDAGALYARLTSPASNPYGYILEMRHDLTSLIIRGLLGAGGETSALATYGIDLVAGDKAGMTVKTVGNDYVVEAWYDSGSGWTLAGTYTDVDGVTDIPQYDGPGYIGMMLWGTSGITRSLDDFGGGDIVTITLDNCLPDADVTTTGWTTTPLYSKVNDASDATVIQATAS